MAASGISFSDVASDAWYAPYVTWAAQNGIVMGSGDKFSPDSKITREDMAVIIDRYVEKLASRQLEKVNEPKDFTDSSEISDYAAEAVSVMQGRRESSAERELTTSRRKTTPPERKPAR